MNLLSSEKLTYPVGTRVRLKHDVDRFPHFIAPAGSLGKLIDVGEPGLVVMQLDKPLPGAEEWRNEIHWYLPNGDRPLLDMERPLDDLIADAQGPYETGFVNGLCAYAWWKDGRQYVGTMGTSLNEAIEKFLREFREAV